MRSWTAWRTRIAMAAAVTLVAGVVVVAPSQAFAQARPATRDTIVVGVPSKRDMPRVRTRIEALGGTVRTTYRWGAYVVEVPAGADAAAFSLIARMTPGVRYANRNAVLRAVGTANDPHFLDGSQWHLTRVGAPTAWDSGTGAGVIVAVLDTGIDSTHTDLAGAAKSVEGTDLVNLDGDPTDDQGHGTAMAGLIGAWRNNGLYGASVAPDAKLMAVKVLDAGGTGSEDVVAAGVRWAADHGADVINLSLGTVDAPAPCVLSDAVDYARSLGCLVVAASGNASGSGLHATMYPAAYVGVIGVGASTADTPDAVWFKSAHGVRPTGGNVVTLVAPGVDVYTLSPGSNEVLVTGTSASTAVVSGAAAAVWSRYPAESAGQIAARLTATALDIGTPGVDQESGAGRLRIDWAIADDVTAPDGMTAHSADPGPEAVVTWTDRSDNESGFVVERAQDTTGTGAFSQVATVVTGVTSYHDVSGLDWISTWFYRVRAFNASGVSAYTDPVGIKLDTTPPTTTLRVNGSTTIAAWYRSLPTVTLAATDSQAGVWDMFVDRGSGLEVYPGGFTVPEGVNPITYWSVDHADNAEPARTATINVDTIAPVASSDATTTHYHGIATINLYASDSGGSGVARRVYKTSAGGAETSLAVATLGGGTYQFYVGAYDVAGNGPAFSGPVVVTVEAVSAPVHRFYNRRTGVHFYTINEEEKANVLSHTDWPFTYEGVAYSAFPGPVPGSTPVYRFYNRRTNVHFYTANEDEKANVLSHRDWPFDYEGVGFYVLPGPADATPVYRFYNPSKGVHFYTASEDERYAVQTNLWRVYDFEGAAFYVPR